MTGDSLLPFSFPAVRGKKIAAAFDGGRITSDGGVMALALAARHLGVAERLSKRFPDARDPQRITHTLSAMIRARIFAIACGYEDADDLDFLRTDPAFQFGYSLPRHPCDQCPRRGHERNSRAAITARFFDSLLARISIMSPATKPLVIKR